MHRLGGVIFGTIVDDIEGTIDKLGAVTEEPTHELGGLMHKLGGLIIFGTIVDDISGGVVGGTTRSCKLIYTDDGIHLDFLNLFCFL
jgi:hypothetical protein